MSLITSMLLSGGSASVAFGDSQSLDAFGNLRTSSSFPLFDSQLTADEQPLFWNEKTAGSGATTYTSATSTVHLDVTTADGDSVIRQTKEYFRYRSGSSQKILLTAVIGAGQAGTTKLVGYGDDNNGLFFGQDGTGLFVMLRSDTSGSVVDTKTYQTSWNLDSLDGSGDENNPSGLNVDVTKSQLFMIDFAWLGVGRVRFSIVIGGAIVTVHELANLNALTSVYMATPDLPIRYEITNTAAVAGAAKLVEICCSVSMEGGSLVNPATPFSTVDLANSITTSATIPLIVRHKSTFNSKVNRGKMLPLSYGALTASNNLCVQIIYNPTFTGSPTWSSVDANSIMEISTDVGTGFSGGTIISSFIIPSGSGNNSGAPLAASISDKLPIGLDIDGANPIPIGIQATGLGGTATADFHLDWEEIN